MTARDQANIRAEGSFGDVRAISPGTTAKVQIGGSMSGNLIYHTPGLATVSMTRRDDGAKQLVAVLGPVQDYERIAEPA